jgi:hypothetical protein
LDTLSPKLKSGRTNHTPTFFSFFKKIRVDIAKHELISVHQRPKDSSLPFKSSAFSFAKREQIYLKCKRQSTHHKLVKKYTSKPKKMEKLIQ